MQSPMVDGQRWTDLAVPDLGQWDPTDRVAVVLPARDNQEELDRTLAALGHQTYPAGLLEIVVVDDASSPALELPEIRPHGTRIVRRDTVTSHGSGPARAAGAEATDAEIILFLDSDMIADPRHVEAHARWHHVCDSALVLGHKWFVSVEGITPEDIDEAARAGLGPGDLLADRPQRGHGWQEEMIAETDRLTLDLDDTFLAVVGATVSIRADRYQECGGFSAIGRRGIVDTEFGYRAFTKGLVIVPDEQAESWHQGARSFTSRGKEIKRERLGLAANHLPLPMFRPQNVGRRWAVPMIRAIVDIRSPQPVDPSGPVDREATPLPDTTAEAMVLTIDSVLSSDLTDLTVEVITGGVELPAWVADYLAQESRVSVRDDFAGTGFPSPYTLVVPPGVLVGRRSVSTALSLLTGSVRVIRTLPDEYRTPGLELWRTRTLERTLRGQVDADGLGERWCTVRGLELKRVRPRLTPQGMVTSW